MSTALFNRLRRVYDTTVETDVMNHQAQWRTPRRGWGDPIHEVRAFVVHETSGWPARARVDLFQDRYWRGWNEMVNNPHPPPGQIQVHRNPNGFGTQWFISGDGTVFSLIEFGRVTFHGNFVNTWSLGSETAHGEGHGNGNIAPPGNVWEPLNGVDNPAAAGYDDIPGAKLWWRARSFNEMVASWWTTARFAGPQREPIQEPEMLFTDAQYRSWALLARFAAERFLIPRNFPLLPHVLRNDEMLNDWRAFRRIVRADEVLTRNVQIFGWTDAQVDDDAQLSNLYPGGLAGGTNRHWRTFFENDRGYRGFHGHGFSGDPDGHDDHYCPGPLFDWHRFAREVYDYWWHPFDFNAAGNDTNVARRPYSPDWDGDTPITEHYFSTTPATYATRQVPGIHGNPGSPRTYRLEQGSRVYALANGELVAARFPAETGGVSLALMIVRHEVYHRLHPLAGQPLLPTPIIFPERIDYDIEPSTVYSLYMHLGRPAGMSFDSITTDNPDWLNRLLMRKKEADVGVTFHRDHAAQVPNATWNAQPPGDLLPGQRARRPTILEGWTADQTNYEPTLNRLRTGDFTLMPRDAFATPVKILLGDFLGVAGVINRTAAAVQTHGIRVEIFSPAVISTDFTLSASSAATRWNATGPAAGTGGHAVRYPSEWFGMPEGAERTALEAAGVNVDLLGWWDTFALVTQLNPQLPADAVMPNAGDAIHYDPPAFMAWLNRRTWRSEWPKYGVADASGTIPAAPRPRT